MKDIVKIYIYIYIYIIILKNDKKILKEVSMQNISIRRYKKTVEKLLKNDKIYNR